MQHKTLNSFIKRLDDNISTIKLIETNNNDKLSYTVEIKQGLFITELQYGNEKMRALLLYGALIDSKLDLYLDKFSDKKRACDICGGESVILYSFDDNTILCENCASQHGIEI